MCGGFGFRMFNKGIVILTGHMLSTDYKVEGVNGMNSTMVVKCALSIVCSSISEPWCKNLVLTIFRRHKNIYFVRGTLKFMHMS